EQDRERERERHAEGEQQQRERQPAPATVFNVRQAENAAPHQGADQCKADAPDGYEPRFPEETKTGKQPEGRKKKSRYRRAPVLLERIGAEQDEAVFLGDEAPARAGGGAAGGRIGSPHGPDERPFDEPVDAFPYEEQQEHREEQVP